MRISTIIALLLLAMPLMAQRNEIHAPNIASLTVMTGDRWQEMPVTTFGGQPINIDFDELSHEYHRYTYRIEHCEADWTPSEGLFTSDYISGFYDDNIIEDTHESVGTYQDYTHYHLSIPNERCTLTMSGNYKLTVLDDNNEDEPVLTACFMICEGSAGIAMGMRTNTDIDVNARHQQINLQVKYGRLNVTSPDDQLSLVVMQNQRWDNAVQNPSTRIKTGDGLIYDHSRDLIFAAGNEYHKFETLDPTHTTMGLASVGWDSEMSEWHAYVAPDYPRPHYVYDVDANGSFLIRNSDNIDNNTQSDYIVTHFELHAPLQRGKVFLNGAWTNDRYLPEYEMEWNEEENMYEATLRLKQGYYSYRYILMDDNGTLGNISTEGDFFETENTYQALLYFRGPGDRSDRLVAYANYKTE